MSQPDPTTVTRPTPSTTPADAGSSAPSILVLGGTGLMGREVLGALRRRGARARVLVRDPARLATLEGVDVHVGDLRDPASLRRAMQGVDVVFHISPHEADEVELTRTVITACEEHGARLVFAGVHATGRTALHAWLARRFYGLLLPRYRGKFAIGRMVESSATNPVILVPSNFMQNDEVLLDVIEGGQFVHPCHPRGLNRVDLRDVGEVAAGILLDPSTPAGSYGIVGPRSLTGPECAGVWSRALGRPVRYAGDDDAALEAALGEHLTGHRHDDWLSSLRTLRGFEVHATPEELATTQRLLGRRPTDYTEFVRRVLAERSESGARVAARATT
ncbi:SDR family oxidoreductase [Fodinibacter luteus]|uniref:SDR family oxidoreductase n=1 Tax=Fodinibacter luteus TaxID=552064 RepID=UPI0031E91C33